MTSNRLPILAAEINSEHKQIEKATRRGLQHAIHAGKLLTEAKSLVRHGEWLPWLKDNCHVPARTASMYMRLFAAKNEIGNVADLSTRKAVKLLIEKPGYDGNDDGNHYWLVPPDLYDQLNKEFAFDFDPCPYPRPHGFDGLTCEWGKSSFVNPPFVGPTAWARKAIAEHAKGKTVVMIFPVDRWVLRLLEAGVKIRNLGNVKFGAIDSEEEAKGAARPIACFILD